MKASIMPAAAAALILVACGQQDQATGGLTAEESRRLNEHAETLDASPDSLTAEDVDFANEAWPEDEPANATR